MISCLLWKRRDDPGYAYTRWRGKETTAHRAMYEAWYGPVPNGLVVHHKCRNTRCVNPEHLEAVTQQTNILLGTSASARNARKTHCPHGHEYTPDNIYVVQGKWRMCRACQIKRSADSRAARKERK